MSSSRIPCFRALARTTGSTRSSYLDVTVGATGTTDTQHTQARVRMQPALRDMVSTPKRNRPASVSAGAGAGSSATTVCLRYWIVSAHAEQRGAVG